MSIMDKSLCGPIWRGETRIGIAESYTKYIFNIIRNSQIVSQSGCTIFYLHQQCMRGSGVFTSSLTLGIFRLFKFYHSEWVVVY